MKKTNLSSAKSLQGKSMFRKICTAFIFTFVLATALTVIQYQFEDKEKIVDKAEKNAVNRLSHERLDKLTYEYDQNLFEIRNDFMQVEKRDVSVPVLVFKDTNSESDILTIMDLDSMENNFSDLEDVMYFSGAHIDSELRPITFFNQERIFLSQIFGDGGPAVNGCSQGSGVYEDHIYNSTVKLGIIVHTSYEETRCTGQETKKTFNPDKKTIESILKTVESVKFNYN